MFFLKNLEYNINCPILFSLKYQRKKKKTKRSLVPNFFSWPIECVCVCIKVTPVCPYVRIRFFSNWLARLVKKIIVGIIESTQVTHGTQGQKNQKTLGANLLKVVEMIGTRYNKMEQIYFRIEKKKFSLI